MLRENKKEILSEGPEQIGNPSVNNTLTISIDRLEKLNPEVRFYFQSIMLFYIFSTYKNIWYITKSFMLKQSYKT